jgi:demethylmenaquinone methyltransferase/2-methoxy-6-polyprenyl-1,4-benzoquinol methylase
VNELLRDDDGAGDCVPGRFDAKAATPEQKEAWVHKTFENISEKYDLMNDLESFGLHRAWKRKLVRTVRDLKPSAVLDVASGTGDIALALATDLPGAKVVGFDFSANMLEVARKRADAQPGLTNIEFLEGNALALPFEDATFDAASISFGLRNMADYRGTIEEMTRVLRPGGCFLCLEASYPTTPVIKQVFRLYFRHIMPLIGKLVTRKSAEYQWLNDSTEVFLSKPQLAELMEQCGLTKVSYHSFALGAAALHVGFKV